MQLATGCWRLLDNIYVFPMQFAFCVSQLEVLTSKCLVKFARMGRREEKQKWHNMPETDSHKGKKKQAGGITVFYLDGGRKALTESFGIYKGNRHINSTLYLVQTITDLVAF